MGAAAEFAVAPARPGAASPLREGGGEIASDERPRARLPLPRPCPRCPLLGETPAGQIGTGEKGEDRPEGLEAIELPPSRRVTHLGDICLWKGWEGPDCLLWSCLVSSGLLGCFENLEEQRSHTEIAR